jgi:flagellar basal body L-ring protein FlgH
VLSEKIADARIQYTGTGDNHNAARPGWLARFFNWVF